MATSNIEPHCSICEKETSTFLCRGCSKDFCFDHLTEHRQLLNTQLHHIQNDYNQFRQILNEQKADPVKHPLIQKVNQWKKDSIDQIEQTADECQEQLIHYTNRMITKMESILDDSNEQPLPNKDKNEFNEIDLKKFREKLEKLKEELDQPSAVSVEEESTLFIKKIFVRFSKNSSEF